jgi:hypothetical protein
LSTFTNRVASRARERVSKIGLIEGVILLLIIGITLWAMHPSLILSSTAITGGDTGSHWALPAYLRSQGDLLSPTTWYPGWYSGMPTYTYYFILPDLFAVWLSYIINFAIAFKLMTVLGSVLLPVGAYIMGRLFKAPRPIPIALALATLPFLFDASFTIVGGNLFSTMAGEYSFSLSLALALVTIGLFARGIRTGRGYWLAAICLSVTLAAHILPWFFSIAAVAVMLGFELLSRSGYTANRDPGKVKGKLATPWKFAIGAGALSAALSAWWLGPFITTQNLTNSMGYTNDKTSSLHVVLSTLGWFNATGGAGGDQWVITLGLIACVVAFIVRDRLGMIFSTLVVLSVLAYVLDPQSTIWDERLVPFWYITIHLMVGWLLGYVLYRWVNKVKYDKATGEPRAFRVLGVRFTYAREGQGTRIVQAAVQTNAPRATDKVAVAGDESSADKHHRTEVTQEPGVRAKRLLIATLVVAILGIGSTLPGQLTSVATMLGLNTGGNQVSSWAAYNYSGYQKMASWPEYNNLMQTIKAVGLKYGCGRDMWEYNSSEGRFGTPEALMLMAYWTNNCVGSMEGLLFESSATTPYHFINQSELSASPDYAQNGLTYDTTGPDVALGVKHLQLLGVRYFTAFSPSVIKQANADPQLELIATTKNWAPTGTKWYTYLVKNSALVVPVTALPNVVPGVSSLSGWLQASEWWYLHPSAWGILGAASGPSNWPRAASTKTMTSKGILPKVTITHVVSLPNQVSFHVSRIGIPVEIRISYFPNWKATGATGPYRVTPNLMVVVPTSRNVTLGYANTKVESLGDAISATTIALGVGLWLGLSRRKRRLRKENSVKIA